MGRKEILETVQPRAVRRELAAQFAKEGAAVYPFQDIRIVFESEGARIANADIMEMETSVEALFLKAVKNAEKTDPPFCEKIGDIIGQKAEIEFWAFQSAQGNAGYALAVPDTFRGLADVLDQDLYLIPSSIHEIIAIGKEDCRRTEDEIRMIIFEVNTMDVRVEEILSYNLYRYDRRRNKVEVCL